MPAVKKKPRLLLVDDEPDILKMVGVRLEASGYQVSGAADGEEGLQKARQEHPDLIILDLMLPKLSGYEVCRALKQDPKFCSIPIILFTAMAQEKDEKAGFAAGADAYVRKPFHSQELLAEIQRLLSSTEVFP